MWTIEQSCSFSHVGRASSSGVWDSAAEDAARELGARAIRLSTRGDLVEARALYAKHGYAEIPRYGDDEFADHWLEKPLKD